MTFFSATSFMVFCALLGSAFSYKCISCIAGNSTECEESVIDCVGSRCMTASMYLHNGDKTFHSIYKGCANETLCGASGSLTQDSSVKIRTHAKCCTGNKCNNDKFNLPKENSEPNGKKCPSAFCQGTTEECKTEKEMECTGSENQCYEYRGTVQTPDGDVDDYSEKGCINALGCKENFAVLIGVEEIKRVLLTC